jgi:pimeloyl-ACP methyl ester carboxylesterase
MLALAYAAAHPASAGPIVLVGCGTFDTTARARMKAILDERLDDAARRAIAAAGSMNEIAALVEPVYLFDPVEEVGGEACDDRAHGETWNDMLRLQAEGVYPAAFAAIESPVLMLHGAYDPHPGRLIRDSLAPHLRSLEYREFERCGHYPWIERGVRDEFLSVLRDWITRNRCA